MNRDVFHAATWSLDRRRFIAGAGAATLMASAPGVASAPARAQEAPAEGFSFETAVDTSTTECL